MAQSNEQPDVPERSVQEHARSLGDEEPLQSALRYRGYAGVVRALADLADAGVPVRVCGRSVEAEPIYAVVLGDPEARDVSVVMAGIHAMEWIGVEAGLRLATRLFRDRPAGRRVVYFPLVNVDGYRQVEADLRAGRRAWRRANARGVDLNRNWPTQFRPFEAPAWGKPFLLGHGSHALSEPETSAVCSHIEDVARDARVTHALSLHSFGRKVLFPYGAFWRRARDHRALYAAALGTCSRMSDPYDAVQCSRWVPGPKVRGMELDHLYEAFGAKALLVECEGGLFKWDGWLSLFTPFRWFNPPDPAVVGDAIGPALEWFVRGG